MTNRKWNFFRAGGFYQVKLDTGADLLALDELDQKLWVALACPTKGLEFDSRTLELIDSDKDGRIRAPELIAAAKWAGQRLKDPEVLARRLDALPLSAINDATDDGRSLLASATTVLEGLGVAGASELSVAQATEATKAFSQMAFNGDGIVPPDSATDAATAEALQDIVDSVGGVTDRSGKQGVDAAKVEAFYADAQAHATWAAESDSNPALSPLGDDTAAAVAAFEAVRAKVDDYFARCRLVAFDPRAQASINREEKEYLALVVNDLTLSAEELESFPLAQTAAGKALSLGVGINPAWTRRLAALIASTVKPLLGELTELTESQWLEISAKLAPFRAWQEKKAGASVEKLGAEKIARYAGLHEREKILTLIAQDAEKKIVADGLEAVERLVRYNRDLLHLANNFVSFREFYGRTEKAVFQAGRLYLDQRSCDLVMRVDDPARHSTLAPLSRAYLVYCDCVRQGGEKMSIVAAITAGDVDNLMVGRNGVFYDRDGNDWDATVTKIVEAPISIKQAFLSPYKKAIRFVEEQINKRANDAAKASEGKLTNAAGELTDAVEKGKPEAPAKAPKAMDIGILAAIGVAVGGVTAAFGALLQAFFGLGIWMPLGIVGLFLLISGPSMFLAWLKLRQRNLGPMLDANGWAVNAMARINVPFGGSLTTVAALPPGANRDLADPFEEKRAPVKRTVAAAAAVVLAGLWFTGHLDAFLPKAAKHSTVMAVDAEVTPAPVDATAAIAADEAAK